MTAAGGASRSDPHPGRPDVAGDLPASIFVSHGAPSLPLDDVPARDFLRGLGARFARPRAIVAISAHTVAHGVAVGSAPRMHAVHDFGGFPAALYALRYDPPGDPALATRVAGLLADAGIEPTDEVPIDGLDHGIWVPLLLMYPQADIPVVVVSLDARMDAALHVAVGRALAGLHDEGILVLGSGSVTHNLRDVFARGADAPVAPYARRFADWVSDAVQAGGADLLQDWSIAPEAARAHPTSEHFAPLLVAAGAGGPGTVLHESFTAGVLAMHAYAFEPRP